MTGKPRRQPGLFGGIGGQGAQCASPPVPGRRSLSRSIWKNWLFKRSWALPLAFFIIEWDVPDLGTHAVYEPRTGEAVIEVPREQQKPVSPLPYTGLVDLDPVGLAGPVHHDGGGVTAHQFGGHIVRKAHGQEACPVAAGPSTRWPCAIDRRILVHQHAGIPLGW